MGRWHNYYFTIILQFIIFLIKWNSANTRNKSLCHLHSVVILSVMRRKWLMLQFLNSFKGNIITQYVKIWICCKCIWIDHHACFKMNMRPDQGYFYYPGKDECPIWTFKIRTKNRNFTHSLGQLRNSFSFDSVCNKRPGWFTSASVY